MSASQFKGEVYAKVWFSNHPSYDAAAERMLMHAPWPEHTVADPEDLPGQSRRSQAAPA